MTITVLIPTYRRVMELSTCLAAVQRQVRLPDQVIITVRDHDAETYAFLSSLLPSACPPTIITVNVPGVIAAMNAAIPQIKGEIIAITDDDAAPWPDWLERIEGYFSARPDLGGIGGRDWQYTGKNLDDGYAAVVGQLQWWGRVTGGHHHAKGLAQEVHVIKGVNCAYRTSAIKVIGFDSRLLGSGAQVHWELSLGLAMRRAGWRIIFDPNICVDHFPAIRFDEDQRGQFNDLAVQNAVANETLVLAEHFQGFQRLVFILWAILAGTRGSPGLCQVPRLFVLRQPHTFRRWWATLRGRVIGLQMADLRLPRTDVAASEKVSAAARSSETVRDSP